MFVCNLEQCKGACCWEGDFGAPLEPFERQLLEELLPFVKSHMTKTGIKTIEKYGISTYFPQINQYGTSLQSNGACVFMNFDNQGIAQCAIEKAYEKEHISFQKPISCHLYPLRVSENNETNFIALNYDQWEICNSACLKGKDLKIPVYQFVKGGLIRKFGSGFYKKISQIAKDINRKLS